MSQIHILDGQTDQLLDYVQADNIIDDSHKKSLENTLETFNFIAFGDKPYAEHIGKRNRLIIPDEDGTYREFIIFEAPKYRDTEGLKVQAFSHASYLELKKLNVIYPNKFKGTISQHAGRALNKTGWRVGVVEGAGTKTITINEHTSPYENLRRISKDFDVELRFRVETDGSKITGRYVDFLERIGEWRGREVEFGKDLMGIKRVEKQDVVTALLGIGPEKEDGTRIEVLVEDFDALQRWGWYDEYGNLNHLIEPYEIQSERTEMTDKEARRYTRTALNKRINAQVTYEAEIVDLEHVPGLDHEKIRFGDTIKIKDTKFNPPLYVEARVFEQERSIKMNEKKSIVLGDFIEYTEEQVHDVWKRLEKQIKDRVSHYEMVEYTYDKLTIDDKDETVFEEGKTFAKVTGIQAEENAKAFAVEEDERIKLDVEQYADTVAEQQAQSALEQAKMYSVAKTVYENKMKQIAEEMADKAGLTYVDGKLVVVDEALDGLNAKVDKKADGSTVYTIEDVDNMINNTVSKTQYATDQQGVVKQLESHSTRLGQNEKAIGLKADDTKVDQVNNSLTKKIGILEVKADKVTTRVSDVEAEVEGLEYENKNLISHSEYNWEDGYWGKQDGGNKVSHSNTIRLKNRFDLEPSKQYTLTSYGYYTAMLRMYDSNDRLLISRESPADGFITFTTKADVAYGRIYFRTGTTSQETIHPDQLVSELRMKLENGDKSTPWNPAIDDLTGLEGKVKQSEGEIEVLKDEVKLKASTSTVDSLDRRVSTAEGELKVLPGKLSAKVSKDGAFGELNLSPDKALLDFERVNITGKLEAKHIKSLAGLNINDQFVVDSKGKVTIGNNRVTIDDKSIRITRPDGAVWMEDGLTKSDYAISGYDPRFTTQAESSTQGKWKAITDSDSWYTGLCKIIDGRGEYAIEGVKYKDVRDHDKGYTVRFQRYEFVHNARYLQITYQIAKNSRVPKHRVRVYESGTVPSGYKSIYFSTDYAEGNRGTKQIIVDMGKPSYKVRSIDFRIGHLKQWVHRDDAVYRFKIRRVVQRDEV